VAPYEVLLEPIRDHAALVIPETGAAKVEKTPADLPFKAFQTLEATGSVDKDGTATSRMVLTERGDAEVYLRAVLRQIAPAQYDVLAQKLSESMGYGGKATHAEVSRAEDTAEPFKISYDYQRDKIADWSDKQIVPQVAPVTLPQVDEKDPPLQSIALGGVRVESSKSAQKLPDGWRAELPEAIHQKSAWATVDQTYRFEKGVLYSERKVDVLAEKVPVADWKAYKKFCDDAMVGQEQYVTLVPTGADAKGDAGTSHPLGSNPAAAKLVLDAYNAIARHELDAAGPMLDQAKQLNPEQARLWSTYGYLEFQRNKMANAAADYEKELALHPDAHGVYASLVQSQINLHRTADAKETLRKWALVDPENPQPVSRLATLLLTEGDALGAAAAVTASLSQMSADAKKNEGLQLLLGRAQIKAGMKDKGDATLVALLHSTENSGIMNDAAYELADAGLELPLAETMTQTALGRMEDESRNWTLDENLQTLRNKSSLIAATWDTRGWILFRDGKVDEAEKYVKAAWLNRQSSDIGEHVAAIALKKGDRDAALTALTLAIVSAPASDAPRLTAQAADLRKGGAKTSVKNAQVTLQDMRTLALGPANGLNGTAEYRMLLSADKVDRVEATGDKTLPGGDERLMKADFKGWVPEGSKAELVKMAMLNCHSGVCELVIEP
jgi:tetratricopeptide (TPR) repeat protein